MLVSMRRQLGLCTSIDRPQRLLRARFVEAAAWSVGGAACLRVFNLIAWVVCGRLLGRAGFGELSMVVSTTGTLAILAGMGLGVTATKSIAEHRQSDPIRAGRIAGLASATVLVSGTAIAVLLATVAPALAMHVLANPHLTTALRLGALLVWCGALNAYQTGALAGFEAFRAIARVNLCCGIISLPVIVPCARLWGLHGAIAGLIAAQGLNCILSHLALRQECAARQVIWSIAGCKRELPMLSQCALPALLSSLLLLPAMWTCNAWLARQPGGYAQLGIYAAADRWRLLILFVPNCILGTTLPMLSNLRGAGARANFQEILKTNVRVNILLVAGPGIAVAAMAKLLISAFGIAYAEGWHVLPVMAVGATAEALNTALGQPLMTESMWRRLGFDALLVAVLLGGAWFLIPRWGAVGLALAYAVAFTTVALALSLYARKRSGFSSACEGANPCPES